MRSRSIHPRSRSLLTLAALAVLAAGSATLLAQQQPAQSSSTPPAPTSKSSATTPPPSQPTDDKTKPAPKPTAEDNPFPEEQSEAAQKQVTEQDRADAKAASSGSVATDPDAPDAPASSSSSRDKFAGIDILGDHDSRISNGAGGTIVDPKLSTQDLKVGQQYFGMGNYQGAYERFKEAVTVNPANADAVFYLAEAARKTAHLDESAENYRIYLDANPEGPKAKAARKALEQLTGK